MKIFLGKKQIHIPLKKTSPFGKFIGLMFRTKNTDNLLFEFNNAVPAIHSFFVFFPFLAVWLNEKNHVVDMDVVRPFTPLVRSKKLAVKLVELPFNERNQHILKFLVDKKKFKYI